MKKILTFVFLIGAMVALSAKPCEVKTHDVPSYQYTVCEPGTLMVIPFVNHDVLGEVETVITVESILLRNAEHLVQNTGVLEKPRIRVQNNFNIKLSGTEQSLSNTKGISYHYRC